MTDSETEEEILARIEAALQRIAAAGKPVPVTGVDKAMLVKSLDTMIDRLRGGLEPPGADTARSE